MRLALAAAVLAALAAAPARADDPYASLVGMATAAATDRGPDAGAPPRGGSAAPARHAAPRGLAADEGAVPDVLAAARASGRLAGLASGAAAAGLASVEARSRGAFAPAGWARLRFYADLVPYWPRGVPFYDLAVSTAPARARLRGPSAPAPLAGVRVGVRLGWDELFAAAAAPAAPPRAR